MITEKDRIHTCIEKYGLSEQEAKRIVKEDDMLLKLTSDWDNKANKSYILNIVGKCSTNIWNNEKRPQIIISDYEIIQ